MKPSAMKSKSKTIHKRSDRLPPRRLSKAFLPPPDRLLNPFARPGVPLPSKQLEADVANLRNSLAGIGGCAETIIINFRGMVAGDKVTAEDIAQLHFLTAAIARQFCLIAEADVRLLEDHLQKS